MIHVLTASPKDALQEVDRQVRNITESDGVNISALSEAIRIGYVNNVLCALALSS